MFKKLIISFILTFSFLLCSSSASAININNLKSDSNYNTQQSNQSNSFLQSQSFDKFNQKSESKINPAPVVFEPLPELFDHSRVVYNYYIFFVFSVCGYRPVKWSCPDFVIYDGELVVHYCFLIPNCCFAFGI